MVRLEDKSEWYHFFGNCKLNTKMELDEIKYLYLLLYRYWWCYFLSIPIGKKKATQLGIGKKTKSDRSVLNLFLNW
jgi:hypothetical protein